MSSYQSVYTLLSPDTEAAWSAGRSPTIWFINPAYLILLTPSSLNISPETL